MLYLVATFFLAQVQIISLKLSASRTREICLYWDELADLLYYEYEVMHLINPVNRTKERFFKLDYMVGDGSVDAAVLIGREEVVFMVVRDCTSVTEDYPILSGLSRDGELFGSEARVQVPNRMQNIEIAYFLYRKSLIFSTFHINTPYITPHFSVFRINTLYSKSLFSVLCT